MPNLDNDDVVPEVRDCVGCHYPIGESLEIGFEGTRGPVCVDCHANCGDCGMNFNLRSGNPHADYAGEVFCYRCTRNNFITCYHCDDYERDEQAAHVQGGARVCEDCRDNRYTYCDNCDEYINDGYGDHQDSCFESGQIHSYDYRPVPIFLHKQEDYDNASICQHVSNGVVRKYRQIAYMGFELEVEYKNQGLLGFGDGVASADIENVTYLKSDGSLNHGFEMVTHPMTLAWAMEHFPWERIEHLNDGSFSGWDADTAGLHIHVSRDGFFSYGHQARFIHLITRNQHLFESLAGRSSARWARFDTSNLRNISRKLRHLDSSERYLAVNIQNRNTLEVRIFQSSLKTERIKMCLQLVDASVKYTENLACDDIIAGKAFDSKSFIAWVATRPEYEILNSYLDTFSSTGQVGE